MIKCMYLKFEFTAMSINQIVSDPVLWTFYREGKAAGITAAVSHYKRTLWLLGENLHSQLTGRTVAMEGEDRERGEKERERE